MRISDWSSDVCSSDLRLAATFVPLTHIPPLMLVSTGGGPTMRFVRLVSSAVSPIGPNVSRSVAPWGEGADRAAGIDGVSETDGLDMISRPVGPPFPRRVQSAASNPPRIGIIKPVTLSPPRKGGRHDGDRAAFAEDEPAAGGARLRLAGLCGA